MEMVTELWLGLDAMRQYGWLLLLVIGLVLLTRPAKEKPRKWLK